MDLVLVREIARPMNPVSNLHREQAITTKTKTRTKMSRDNKMRQSPCSFHFYYLFIRIRFVVPTTKWHYSDQSKKESDCVGRKRKKYVPSSLRGRMFVLNPVVHCRMWKRMPSSSVPFHQEQCYGQLTQKRDKIKQSQSNYTKEWMETATILC